MDFVIAFLMFLMGFGEIGLGLANLPGVQHHNPISIAATVVCFGCAIGVWIFSALMLRYRRLVQAARSTDCLICGYVKPGIAVCTDCRDFARGMPGFVLAVERYLEADADYANLPYTDELAQRRATSLEMVMAYVADFKRSTP